MIRPGIRSTAVALFPAAATILAAVASCALLTACGPKTASTRSATTGTAAAAASTSAGTSGGGTGTGGGVACDLVTEQDATAAIGEPSGPGTPGGTAALSECLFDEGALIISMKSPGRDLYDKQRAALTGKAWTDVPGIGDGAFEVSGAGGASIAFIKGTTLVEIVLTRTGSSPSDHAIALAKIAASHI